MKRSLLLSVLCVCAGFAGAQVLDQPVATVKLTKTEIVSQKDFRDKLALVEQATKQTLSADEKKDLLNELVANILILQAAEKAGVKVSDSDVLNYAKAQLNAKLSDDDFKKAVEKQTGAPWAKFADNAKKQMVAQKFVMSNPKAADLEKVSVTDTEVSAFFEENKAQFVSPEMVRVSHILFDTKVKPNGSVDQIRQRADDTYKQIADGKATFEEMVRKASDDKSSAAVNGDIGFVPRSTSSAAGQQYVAIFGKDFLTALYGLKKGEVSKVLTSNLGFHIVRVTDKLDQRFLGLNDQITPMQPTTVKEYIRGQLTQRNQQQALQKLLADVVEDLKKQATINLYTQNL